MEPLGREPLAHNLAEIGALASPNERLARVEAGDPFLLGARTQEQLRGEGWVLSPGRAIERAAARVAMAAPRYRPPADPEAWLSQRVTRAIADLLREQETEEYHRIPLPDSPDADFYREFAAAAGVPERYGRLVCLHLNQRPAYDRCTFRHVVVEGESINRWVAQGQGPPARVEATLREIGQGVLRLIDRADSNGGNGGIARGFG